MADQDQDQKTEQPTGKKLSEAISQGQWARAPEMQVLFTMAATLGVLGFTGRTMAERVAEYTVGIFSRFGTYELRTDTVVSHYQTLLVAVAPIILPVLLACAIAAIVSGGLQSGFNLSPKALGIHWDRLDITQGFARVFAQGMLVRAGIDILKMIAVGSALYVGARQLMRDPLFSVPVETSYLLRFINGAAMSLFGRLLLSLSLLAAISLGYEKFKTLKDLRMTKQEVKDEMRNSEGDPLVKGAQKRAARRLLMKQMLDQVPQADVVITNPTHYAVALKYERGKDQAPIVLAKGENRFARRIKAIAAENGVPMVENKPVARLLFAMGKVGEAIPPELYQAVAEILAVVYRTHRYYFYRLRSRRLETQAAS